MSALKSQFDSAATYIRGFNPSKAVPDSEKLTTYSLFKQATVGDNNTDRPGMMSFEAKAKWDAWTAKKGLSADAAMTQYIAHVEHMKSTYL